MKQEEITYDFNRMARDITGSGIDLFATHEQWYKGAMALSCLGEDGRQMFHAISSMSPVYKHKDSERQFTHALRAKHRIGIGTFLWMVRDAGIDISLYRTDSDGQQTPAWSKRTYPDKPAPPPTPPPSYIPQEYLEKSCSCNSNFVAYLSTLYRPEDIQRCAEDYFLGATKAGGVIFWQVDTAGKIRSGKIMAYDSATGHRLHTSGATTWVHSLMQRRGLIGGGYNLRQCLFGEHLLAKYPEKQVAVVEAEKTAVIASLVFPDYVWVATGGRHGMGGDKMKALEGRKVIVFPDTDTDGETYRDWCKKSKEMTWCSCIVSDLLERQATPADKQAKIDIADWLCKAKEQATKALTELKHALDDMVGANPSVGQLVAAFDLELTDEAEIIPDGEFYFALHGRNTKKTGAPLWHSTRLLNREHTRLRSGA